METVLILGIFALLVIFIILFFAFRNNKPTTINHGTIHNHYYVDGEKAVQEKPRTLVDENVRQVFRDAGELHREFKGEKPVEAKVLPK